MVKRRKTKKQTKTIIYHDETPSPIPTDSIVVYNDKQDQEKNLYLCIRHIIVTTFSFNLLVKLLYYYVIQIETEYLIQDIEKIRKRFNSNIYTRIVNEFNLFVVNSIEINTVENSHQCYLFGFAKSYSIQNSQSILTELMDQSMNFENYINVEYFMQIYIHYIRQYIGLGPTLKTIKQFVSHEDMYYDREEKNNLRGAHSLLHDLRVTYEDKMKNYYSFNMTSSARSETYPDAIEKFTDKVIKLMVNPDIMMCNHISSQNKINMRNFKENFVSVNQMAIKDLYNNILDTTDGLVSMRIQNSLVKSVYLIGIIFTGIIAYRIYKLGKDLVTSAVIYRRKLIT